MLWDKSRRIGATYADSYKAFRKRNMIDHRRDLWFSSADESAAMEYALYIRQWGEMFRTIIKETTKQERDADGYRFTNYVAEFPNGSRVNCMSSNPKRFRSKGGDVVLDEFDWHEQPGEMLDAAMPVTTWGYDIRALTTRNGEGSEFDGLVKTAKKITSGELDPEKDAVLNWGYHFTPITVAIEQGLAEKIYKLDHVDPKARERFLRECRARSRNEDAFNQEYMCIPSATASTLIPYDLYNSCIDADCLNKYGDGNKYLGFDVGREKDLTTFWINEEVGDVLVCRKIIRLRKAPYATQLQVGRDLLADRSIKRACGDATGLGDMLVETLQDEFGTHRVEKVKFTSQSKEHMASLVLGRMEDKRVRVPDDPAIRESFHKIRKTITAAGNIRYDAARTEAGHSDEFWAAALSLEAAYQPQSEPEVIII